MELVNEVWYEKCAVRDVILAEKIGEKYPQTSLQCFMAVLWLTLAKKHNYFWSSTNRFALLRLSCHSCSPQMSQCADIFVRWIAASQPNNWRSACESKKDVLVTSFENLDIRRCAQDGVFRASQLNTKLRRNHFFQVRGMLWSCWRPYAEFLQHMKPGSINLNWRQKAIHGMAPSSISQTEKKSRIFCHGQSHYCCLL